MSTTLQIRIDTAERGLIERAAKAAGKNVDDFIQNSLMCSADEVLLNQNLVVTTPSTYAEFLKRLDAPAQPSERLQKTMQIATPWARK